MEQTHRDPQARVLMELATSITLFKTPGGEAYADFPIDGRVETHPLKSRATRDWLALRYSEEREGVPSKTALEATLGVLEARARFRSGTSEVYTRLAWHDGALYLDLHENGVVKVTETGWTVMDANAELPIRFRRPRGAVPLPRPVRGGSLDELRQFLNLPDGHESAWMLTVGWLLGALHPTGPYAVLALHGEKGSAKSTTTRYLRQLIDPSIAPAPVQPRDSGDLTLKAHNNWVVAFDNMSSMPRWLSDGLCRLSTGSGDSKRELYADADEVIFTAKRPCIINGIEELATAGDLLDRAVVVTLPVITQDRRQSDAGLNAAFEEARPRMLGALLDAVANALFHVDQVQLSHAPRMKDFAEWVVAAEMGGGLTWPEGAFLGAYMGNREDAQLLEIEASPVATAVREFMAAHHEQHPNEPWTGTATELRELLAEYADDETKRRYTWPKNGKALSDRLTRDAGALRSVGIEVERGKSGTRSITLHYGETNHVERDGPTNHNERERLTDAPDAKKPSFPFSSHREKEEEIGKARVHASAAPKASTHPPMAAQDEGDWYTALFGRPDADDAGADWRLAAENDSDSDDDIQF